MLNKGLWLAAGLRCTVSSDCWARRRDNKDFYQETLLITQLAVCTVHQFTKRTVSNLMQRPCIAPVLQWLAHCSCVPIHANPERVPQNFLKLGSVNKVNSNKTTKHSSKHLWVCCNVPQCNAARKLKKKKKEDVKHYWLKELFCLPILWRQVYCVVHTLNNYYVVCNWETAYDGEVTELSFLLILDPDF